MYVKTPGVFLKLDITKAFDSLAWPFLFQVLRKKGFGEKWMRWIAILLQTASTKIVVNGCPGLSFIHACGLWQGDPVSPLLFVIAMEALSSMFRKGAELGAVSYFPRISATQRLSFMLMMLLCS